MRHRSPFSSTEQRLDTIRLSIKESNKMLQMRQARDTRNTPNRIRRRAFGRLIHFDRGLPSCSYLNVTLIRGRTADDVARIPRCVHWRTTRCALDGYEVQNVEQ